MAPSTGGNRIATCLGAFGSHRHTQTHTHTPIQKHVDTPKHTHSWTHFTLTHIRKLEYHLLLHNAYASLNFCQNKPDLNPASTESNSTSIQPLCSANWVLNVHKYFCLQGMDGRSLLDLSSLLVQGTHNYKSSTAEDHKLLPILVLWLNINYLKVVGSNPLRHHVIQVEPWESNLCT